MNTANRRSRSHRLDLDVCSRLGVWCLAVCLLCPTLPGWAASPLADNKVDFNRDIRPILSENCYKCHGPDDGARKSNLRFDIRSEPLKPTKSGQIPIVPFAPEKSELVQRITSKDPDKHMPPVQSGKKLSPSQIDTLRK